MTVWYWPIVPVPLRDASGSNQPEAAVVRGQIYSDCSQSHGPHERLQRIVKLAVEPKAPQPEFSIVVFIELKQLVQRNWFSHVVTLYVVNTNRN